MIKRVSILLILIIIFTSFPAWALNTAEIREDSGTVTGFITNQGLTISGDYGINNQWAMIAKFGTPLTRLGAKYQLQSNLSLLMGLTENSPFFGVNGDHQFTRDLTGVYEVSLSAPRQEPSLFYELGFILDIEQEVDLRAGIAGFIESGSFPYLQLGVGYQF